MKKLTILTSLSFLMKEKDFENLILNPDKFNIYAKSYANDFNRRLNGIKNKYRWYNFEQIEVINFFSWLFCNRDVQFKIEGDIINISNMDNNFSYLDSREDDIIIDYINYVNSGVTTTLLVLDVTNISKKDFVDLAHVMLLNNKIDFYIEFYDDE